jgi:hypothetical protein
MYSSTNSIPQHTIKMSGHFTLQLKKHWVGSRAILDMAVNTKIPTLARN